MSRVRQLGATSAGVPEIAQETIGISIRDGGDTVVVTLAEGEFELQTENNGTYSADLGSRRIFFDREIVLSDAVETAYIGFADDNGPDSFGFVTFGFDTDPAKITSTTGATTYSGDVKLIVSGTSRFGFAEGTLALNVDFDDLKVSGSMEIVDDGDPFGGLVIPATQLNLVETSLSNNGFSGTLNANLGGGAFTGVQIGTSNFEGRFYGSDGEAVGGDISATLEDGSGRRSYSVQGGFSGSRD